MIQQDSGQLALERKKNMRKSSVTILDNGEIIPNTIAKQMPNAQKIVIRKVGRDGRINERAKSLSQCKGMKGCDFVECSLKAFGKIPKNLKKACPTIKEEENGR